MSATTKVVDIVHKTAAFTLAAASVYLGGNLLYGIYKVKQARKVRLAEAERTGKSIEEILEVGLICFYFLIEVYWETGATEALIRCFSW